MRRMAADIMAVTSQLRSTPVLLAGDRECDLSSALAANIDSMLELRDKSTEFMLVVKDSL